MLTKGRLKRKTRVRTKVVGTHIRPRLSVFKSAKFIYAQLIDDEKGVTLVSASDSKAKKGVKKLESAKQIGIEIAKKALVKKIKAVVFDRGGFRYHGRVAAVADGARVGGLTL